MNDANPLLNRLEGPAPAMEVALDIIRRSVWVLPLFVGLGFVGWRVPGAISAGYGLAIVLVNFFLAAWILQTTGRISFAMMAGGAGFGFLLRLGLIMAAVLLVKDAWWISLIPLGVTLIVAHLGLLFWELRYVSGSLAFPGLKPAPLHHEEHHDRVR